MKKKESESVDKEKSLKVEVRCTLREEPARIVLDLKERGVVANVREAVVHGLLALHEQILDRDLKEAQVKASKRLNEEEF